MTSSSLARAGDPPSRSPSSDDQTISSCAVTGGRPSCRRPAAGTQPPPQLMRLSWRPRTRRVSGTVESAVTESSRHCCDQSRHSRTLGDLRSHITATLIDEQSNQHDEISVSILLACRLFFNYFFFGLNETRLCLRISHFSQSTVLTSINQSINQFIEQKDRSATYIDMQEYM